MMLEKAFPQLYVDLDGTLLKTDLLIESALRLLIRNPLYLLAMLSWLLRGKAVLKMEIARRVQLDVTALPYNKAFVDWLRSQAISGRPMVLASASHERYATEIASHLGFFSGVLASTSANNLVGTTKLTAIRKHAGEQPFDYAGNAKPDVEVWRGARRAIVVNPEYGVEAAAQAVTEVEAVFRLVQPRLAIWLKAIRIHQWLKNLLIGVPLFTSFHFPDPGALTTVLVAFLAFGLVASATYLVNDLLDLDADRLHPSKRRRPLASGDIGILPACVVLSIMLIGGLLLALTISAQFLSAVIFYSVITLTYSMLLKQYILIDVLCLAGLYTWRIIAGAIAINVDISNWLLAFSMFIFLSLALVKRCTELATTAERSLSALKGRDYRVADATVLTSLGTASGYLSVLVLALFIDAPSTASNYSQPRLLWLLCPLLLYWVSRLWVKTARGEMHDDPIIYSTRDRATWFILTVWCVVTLLAR